MNNEHVNQKTIAAYRFYAKHYALLALLTYWIVWRGHLRRHIRFYRDALRIDTRVLDIATGDGSLAKVALYGDKRRTPSRLTVVDLSKEMLAKAKRKLPASTNFLECDAEQLPFASGSQKLITCFGGLNSFASPVQVLCELSRLLTPDGRIRGSFLLFPSTPWRQRLVRRWIAQGYQTCEPSLTLFSDWCSEAGLAITKLERHGDVVLFEAGPVRDVAS